MFAEDVVNGPSFIPGVLDIFFTFAENISASWRNHLGTRVDDGSKTGASCRPRKFFLESGIFSGLSLRWLTGSGAWSKLVRRGSGQMFLSLSQMNFFIPGFFVFFFKFFTVFAFAGNWRNFLGMGGGDHGSKTGVKDFRLASYVFIHCVEAHPNTEETQRWPYRSSPFAFPLGGSITILHLLVVIGNRIKHLIA